MLANVSRGAETKANAYRHGGAPQRRHAAPLDSFTQLGDALRSVSPLTSKSVDATEHVAVQAAKQGRRGVSTGADTSGVAAHLRLVI